MDEMVEGVVRPSSNGNKDGWKAYWEAQGMPWRTDPEITEERQQLLESQYGTLFSHDEPPRFRNIHPKLERADIEWLIAQNIQEREAQQRMLGTALGPESDYLRVDICGADLSETNLAGLPLAYVCGGLTEEDYYDRQFYHRRSLSSDQELTVQLQRANLYGADLCGADLGLANLEGADLRQANLSSARLMGANLRGARLAGAQLQHAILYDAHMENAILHENITNEDLEVVGSLVAYLQDAKLEGAHLENANLTKVYLQGANLCGAHLEGTNLSGARLVGEPSRTEFEVGCTAADLRGAYLDSSTDLSDAGLTDKRYGTVAVADIHWGSANLGVVEWPEDGKLGDEPPSRTLWSRLRLIRARQKKPDDLKSSPRSHEEIEPLYAFRNAARACRQLATALRSQGLHHQADNFGYRAQVLESLALWRQMRRSTKAQSRLGLQVRAHYLGAFLFGLGMDALAGFGYRPWRPVYWYIVTIGFFTLLYHSIAAIYGPHLSLVGCLILSITSFHGRGFFPGGIGLDDPMVIAAAMEAIVGLLVEVSFIATFTQRFFAR